jgi:ferric-dicitrate binding protein FerR (iron transport regulator)
MRPHSNESSRFMNIPQHIADFLDDYLDGSLDDARHQQLTSWAEESDANASALAAWFLSEAELLDAARVADMCDVFEGLSFAPREKQTEIAEEPDNRQVWSRRVSWLMIAASVCLVLTGAYLLSASGGGRKNSASLANATGRSRPGASRVENPLPSPAILARLADCVWGSGAPQLRVGQDIKAGTTLDIKSGLAQLFFESGAEVVLKGPCQFRIENSMLCKLMHGNVSAEVPSRAAGFTIRGPSAEVIDLGTRFGFSVGDAGTSEVHVFQGEVISRQLDEHGKTFGDDIRLTENQAILFPGERQQAKRLAADEAKFALEVRPLWLQDNIEPLVVDRRVAFWLRAGHGVQVDDQQRVIAWQDLALGDNQVANDAFQPDPAARPRFVENALNGRPAIRFDGEKSHLTTTPMTTTDDQTIVVVFQHVEAPPGSKRIGGQIINYNGPPSRYLPDILSPGVLQLGEKVGGWDGPATSIAAKAFVGRDPGGTDISVGQTRSAALGYRRPHVVAYSYSNSNNEAMLFVNGQKVATASAPTRAAVTSRKVIGKHGIFDQWYFCGNLGEVIVYNTALRPREIKSLTGQLMHFYGIDEPKEAAL